MANPAPQFSPANLPHVRIKGGAFALGNFDGVHLGHQAVVRTAIEKARAMQVPARVLTFEPHPRALFKPGIAPFRLTPAPVKERLLRGLGVDDVIVVPFTPEFSQLPAPEFVNQVLVRDYGVQHIVAGFDFVFGHGRSGNMQNLRTWLAPYGVGVTEVTSFRDALGEVMSSSRAREALEQGDTHTAQHILGRPWSIAGAIERGAQQGRILGYPTANIRLGEYLRPRFGVYAVNAMRVGEPVVKQGIANIGVRPTVGGKEEMLEFHLFDFDANIYGQEWEVELLDFIRPEMAFPGVEALRTQIALDIEAVKSRLA